MTTNGIEFDNKSAFPLHVNRVPSPPKKFGLSPTSYKFADEEKVDARLRFSANFLNNVFRDPEVMNSCHIFAAVLPICCQVEGGKTVLYSQKGRIATRNITTTKTYRFILVLALLILIVFENPSLVI